jgi:hypothetical protein
MSHHSSSCKPCLGCLKYRQRTFTVPTIVWPKSSSSTPAYPSRTVTCCNKRPRIYQIDIIRRNQGCRVVPPNYIESKVERLVECSASLVRSESRSASGNTIVAPIPPSSRVGLSSVGAALLWPSSKQMMPKVRAFVDFVAERIKQELLA